MTVPGKAAAAEELAAVGVCRVPPELVRCRLEADDWVALAGAWDRLPLDPYDSQEGGTRRRRYGRMRAVPAGAGGFRLEPLPHATFIQSASLIPHYRGEARNFAPVESDIMRSLALSALLQLDLEIVAAASGQRGEARLGLHLVRTTVLAGEQRLPAPEGRHQDGHDYIAMHLIRRHCCWGGVSCVYSHGDTGGSPVLNATLESSMEGLVLNDRRMEHDVTTIGSTGGQGWRDMLLVDLEWST